ncbi:MAG TPA: FtsX-like permease family protein, partial [Pseudonocardiaceae bacterium]
MELRAQDPNAPFGAPTLALDSGSYPRGAAEVAVTTGTQTLFNLHVGDTWLVGGRSLRVVGVVENPNNLLEDFALVAPGQLPAPNRITLLFNGQRDRFTPPADAIDTLSYSPQPDFARDAIVLAIGTLGLMFIGLLASAGFAVLAQRRLRAIGMLGALGATDRHIRLVMVANGAIVGGVAAIVGAVVGFVGWLGYAPVVERLGEHRIDRLALPWWLIIAALLLALLTAIVAAWWPARAAARMPIVTALANRPSAPAPARRFAAAGVGLMVVGLVGLAFVRQLESKWLVAAGLLLTILGSLFLAPLIIAGLGRLGARTPVATRIALRDLARYRSRSSAALAAISIAVAIAAGITVELTGRTTNSVVDVGPNLATNELEFYTGVFGKPSAEEGDTVTALAGTLHATSVLPLFRATYPAGAKSALILEQIDAGTVTSTTSRLDVATPDVLRRYGIDPNSVPADADLVTAQAGLAGMTDVQLAVVDHGLTDVERPISHPVVRIMPTLPTGTQEPNLLITEHAMRTLGAVSAMDDWLITTPRPLTPDEINLARTAALRTDSSIDTASNVPSAAELGDWATGVGILIALGVLAMTVGL